MGVSDDRPGGFVYPPHLLASVAGVLRAANWRVRGLDAVALGLDTEAVLDRLPDTDVLIVPVSYGTLAADRAFLNLLRERKPLLKVLAIGPALSYQQVDHGLNDLVDLLITGEPDLAVPAAVKRLLTGAFTPGEAVSPYALAQTAYTPDGRLADLDALPLPAWDLYHGKAHTYPFLTILSSRGCPAGCAFCPYAAAQGAQHRFQSPARTAEEFAYLVERFQPPRIMFRDPVFAHERNRVLALCSELRRLRNEVPWECESRPEHFDNRLLRALRDAGCDTIKIGVESADPEVLIGIGQSTGRTIGNGLPGAGRCGDCRVPAGRPGLPCICDGRFALPDPRVAWPHCEFSTPKSASTPARQGVPVVPRHRPVSVLCAGCG